MGAFLKQAASLIAGKMAGENTRASFVVKTGRFLYVTSAATVLGLWYAAYRNEHVAPHTIGFPFPGLGGPKQYPPDRPEKELQHESSPSFIHSKAQSHTSGRAPTGIPITPEEARKAQGLAVFDGHKVAAWIIPYLVYARAQGWKGQVTSGYRTYAEEVSIANQGIWPHAVPGSSNHGKKNFPGGAVDVSEAEELSNILSSIPGSLLQWAGAKDPVHFSYPHNGGY